MAPAAAVGLDEVGKGFELELLDVNVELKRLLPKLRVAFPCVSCFADFEPLPSEPSAFPEAAFDILTPRIALTVPSFFRQAFLLQMKM